MRITYNIGNKIFLARHHNVFSNQYNTIVSYFGLSARFMLDNLTSNLKLASSTVFTVQIYRTMLELIRPTFQEQQAFCLRIYGRLITYARCDISTVFTLLLVTQRPIGLLQLHVQQNFVTRQDVKTMTLVSTIAKSAT